MTYTRLDNKLRQCQFGTGGPLINCTFFKIVIQKNANKKQKLCANYTQLINVIILSRKEGKEGGKKKGRILLAGWFTKGIEFHLTLEGELKC